MTAVAKMIGKTINWGRWWIDRSTAGTGRAAEVRQWRAEAAAEATAAAWDAYYSDALKHFEASGFTWDEAHDLALTHTAQAAKEGRL